MVPRALGPASSISTPTSTAPNTSDSDSTVTQNRKCRVSRLSTSEGSSHSVRHTRSRTSALEFLSTVGDTVGDIVGDTAGDIVGDT